jgi:hypothetical protein
MFLFKVEERFMVTGRGLVLGPGLGDKKASTNDNIVIVRPDKTTLKAVIRGISFNANRDILVGNNLVETDVPIGSEIWLMKNDED